ncbi:hypothetical protein MTR67_049589 [Solanum verrucosum]|uniref:Uncharacterized protein n=1 Tax=Solanum verrucosum TaxID=315347 RepID=A0AAF0V2X2_SOLVR|nr:hypothetical protein MTR67_049589 [Solanum verrucosum]
MLEDLEAEDDDFVEVNTKASAADGHLQQKQLSPPAPPSVDSTANANGNASDTDMVIACSEYGLFTLVEEHRVFTLYHITLIEK